MKQARTLLLILSGVFLLTEIIFNFIVLTQLGGDPFGTFFKTSLLLVFILLFSKKLNWARWILSIILVINGLLCLLAGLDSGPILYVIGLYDIFFGIFIHTSNVLAVFRHTNHDITQTAEPNEQNKSWESFSVSGRVYRYPRLVKRYQALFIDGILLTITLIMIMILVDDSESRTTIMVSSASLILLTYEPILTAYSKTVGQRLMKIRVGRHENPLERISLLNAYIRWFTKGLLGWISFITINFNPQHRAIHDMASDSVMVNEE